MSDDHPTIASVLAYIDERHEAFMEGVEDPDFPRELQYIHDELTALRDAVRARRDTYQRYTDRTWVATTLFKEIDWFLGEEKEQP